MLLRVASGRKISVSHFELLQLLRRPKFHIFVILGEAVIISATPNRLPQEFSDIKLVIFGILISYVFVGLFTLAFTVASVIYRVRNWKVLHEPILTFIVMIVVTFVATQLMIWMSLYVQMSTWERITNVAINYGITEAFILFYAHFLQRYFVEKNADTDDVERKYYSKSMIAIDADQLISVNEILVVKAQAHYVEITTETGGILARSGFADIVSQIPSALGLQIHRSTWVALKAIEGGENKNGQFVIFTKTKEALRVAKSRSKPVSDFLKDMQITD